MLTRITLSCALTVVFAAAAHLEAAPVERKGDRFRVAGVSYSAAFSADKGSLLAFGQTGATGSIWRSGEHGLWRIRFQDGSEVSAAQFGMNAEGRTFRAMPDGGGLRLEFRSAEVDVTITATGRGDCVDLVGEVTPKQKTVLDFALPARLRFDPAQVVRFICPANGNMSVGTAFRGAFFARQPQDRPSSWGHSVAAGPKGYTALFGGPLDQRADQDAPVALTVTDEGRQWLGEATTRAVEGTAAVVNRPSTRQQVDLVLVDSASGPYFTASRLGGNGHLWRLGGSTGDEAKGAAARMVGAVARKLCDAPSTGRSKLGLVALANGPAKGGWTPVSIEEWRQQLQGAAGASQGVEFVGITTVSDMLAALQSADYVGILNPYGEWAPAPERGGMDATVAAIGTYVRAGGNWFEVGGHPFYYELRPVRYFRHGTDYPPGFADFFHLDSKAGSASIYRVQPRTWEPWEGRKDPNAIFVPGRLACGGDEQGGWCDRPFATYVKPGETWRAPTVRMVAGKSAEQGLQAYCEANQINRRLEDKMPPDVLRKFKESVLVYYAGSAKDKTAHLDKLPVPTQVHFADYLKGGFDKEYPDHLPPPPNFGTPDELRELFARCKQLGHLVSPYTNPTWWCDHPKGPTFAREGEAPLLRRLDGKLSHEQYGTASNDGFTVCHWHPAVRAANRETVRQFTEDFPVDILFQDQCGARKWRYDTNPASPTPYAYYEGLLSMIQEDSQTKPLSTEAGWDGVVNWEAQLCGMSWEIVPTEGGPSWRTPMKSRIPPELWEVFPVAQYIAHDKCAMLYHDLGQFVTNREVLSWTLGLGFCMSYRVGAASLEKDAPREWLRWLDRLQRSVCARYVGEPVRAFEHERPTPDRIRQQSSTVAADEGVIRAAYGPVSLVANLDPTPVTEGERKLPPFGFHASAPGAVAANLQEVGGRNFGEEGVSFVAEGDARTADVWVYAPPEAKVAVELPRPMGGDVSVAFDGADATLAQVEGDVLALRIPARPGEQRTAVPPALVGKPPLAWPDGTPAIGILNIEGMAPSWTDIQPGQYLHVFENMQMSKERGVPVRTLGNVAELLDALAAGATKWLVIVNPYGENFPGEAGKSREMLAAIQAYVNNGGCWWETAGYSFYSFHSAVSREGGATQSEPIGPRGMGLFGIPVGEGEVDQPAEPLQVTPLGRAVLGEALSARVEKQTSAVNRGGMRGGGDPGHVTLVAGAKQDFICGYRLNGWGWLWRVGGFNPNPEVVLPVVAATTEYLYSHAPLPVPAGRTKYLWHAVVRAG